MSNIAAIVKSLVGQVFAVSLDGLKRQIFEGERLLTGEQVLTGLGGEVTLQLTSGDVVNLAQNSNWQAAPSAAQAEAEAEPDSRLEQALAAGLDPTTDLEAPAAGPSTAGGSGGSAGGGHSFVMLDETGQQLEATVGFETEGLGFGGAGQDEVLGAPNETTDANTVQPNRAPTTQTDTFTVNEDGTINIDVLANDSDLDGNTLSISQVNGQAITEGGSVIVSNGSVTLTGGQLAFTPDANYNGPASFTYTVTDGVLSSTATVSGTVSPVNDAPVALGETLSATEDTVVTYSAADLLGNDSDLDGDTLTIASVTSGNGGTAVLNPDGSVTFTPNANFNGTAEFSYTVTDGTLVSSPATATINVAPVNDAPVAANDSITLNEDTPYTGNLLSNNGSGVDSDVDGDTLSVTQFSISGLPSPFAAGSTATIPFVGRLTVASNGDFTFTPNTNYNGPVPQFTYTLSDGSLTDTATLNININAVNDAPVNSVPGAQTVNEDGSLRLNAGNRISVGDVDNGNLSTTLSVQHGVLTASSFPGVTISGNGTGSITLSGNQLLINIALNSLRYAPAANYNGDDQLTITTTDGSLTDTDTVAITVNPVNDAPTVAAPLTAAADEDDASLSLDLLSGATDIDSGDVLSISNVLGLVSGLSLSGSTLTIDPSHAAFQNLAKDVEQQIVITYNVIDSNGGVTPQTATITITGTNDAPTVAAVLTAAANEDAASFTLDLLSGAADIDSGDVLSVSNVLGLNSGLTLSGSTLTIDPSHADFQSLADGVTRDIVISYDVVDGNGGVTPQTATITITGTNDAPTVSAALTAATDEDDASFTLDLLSGAADIDTGDVLTIDNVLGLSNGLSLSGSTLTVDPSHADFQSLAEGVTRDIVISYDVIDSNGGVTPQTATITITGTNDAPIIQSAASAGAGNGQIDKPQGVNNHSLANAINLDGSFVLGNDPDVANSATTPFVSISSTGNNAFDYYAFTVTQAGTTATFDIDYALFNNGSGFDSWLNLFDANGVRLAFNDDNSTNPGGGGSEHAYDAFLSHTFTQPGTYYIAVGRYYDGNTAIAIPSGSTYQLQVSLPNAITANILTERADGSADENTGSLSTSGSLEFSDVDLADTHTVSSTLLSTVDSLNGGAAARGTLTATIGDDSTGDGSGRIDWTYEVDAAALDSLAAGQVLTLTYRIEISDGKGGIDTQDIVITLRGTNDLPLISGDASGAVTEDTGVAAGNLIDTGTLTISDADTGQAAFQTTGITASSGALGSLSITTAGVWTYTVANAAVQYLKATETKTETFTVLSVDGTTHNVVITITGTNDLPLISGDASGAVTEDTGVAAGNLTDTGTLTISDADTGQATFQTTGITASSGALGSLAITTAGVWTYTVANAAVQYLKATETKTETFTVLSVDGTTHNVVITITGTNDLPLINGDAVGAVTEDVSVVGANLSDTGTLNVSDADADQSSFQAGTGTAVGTTLGSLSITTAGEWTYTVANAAVQYLQAAETKTETFTVLSADGTTHNIVVTITGTNDAPIIQSAVSAGAGNGQIDKPQGVNNHSLATAINLDGSFVLGNDPDVANSTTTPFVSISSTGNNAFDYYAFTVTQAGTTATFDIDYAYIGGLDSTLRLYDANGNLLAYNDDNGSSLGGGGSISGLDSFLSHTFSQPGTYYIAVGSWSNGTIPSGNTYQLQVSLPNAITTNILTERADGSADENTGSLSTSGSLEFSDVDLADTHTVSATLLSTVDSLNGGAAARGTLTATIGDDSTGDGSGRIDWTYEVDAAALDDLAAGQTLTLTYRVEISDGLGGTAFQNVVITLRGSYDAPPVVANTPPDGADSTVILPEDGSHVFSAAEFGFNDADAGQTLQAVRIDSLPSAGSLTLNGNPVSVAQVIALVDLAGLVFTPAANANGNAYANFTFSVQDSAGGFDTAPNTIILDVTAVNDAPISFGDSITVAEGGTATILVGGATSVLTNDSDAENDPLTAILVTGPNNGTLTLNANGTFSYTHNGSETTTDSFTYKVNDGTVDGNTVTVTIGVSPVNDAPVAVATIAEGNEDSIITVSLKGSDVDGTVASFKLSSLAANGTFYSDSEAKVVLTTANVISASDNGATIYFKPNANWSGSTNFTLTATDNSGATSSAVTEQITVIPVADAPNLSVTPPPPTSSGMILQTWIGLSGLGSGGLGAAPSTLQSVIDGASAPNSTQTTTDLSDNNVSAGTANKISGLVYLEAGSTYTFSGVGDDSFRLVVGDTVVAQATWGEGGNFRGTFTPGETGYYNLSMYQHNQSGPGTYDVNMSVNGGAVRDLNGNNFLIFKDSTDAINAGVNIGTGANGFYPVNQGLVGKEDSSIKLSGITASLTDTDGSETLSLTIGGIPLGATITDGTPANTFTATAGQNSVDISGWTLSSLSITPPQNFSGNFTLTVTATATEKATAAADPGHSSSTSNTIPVTVTPVTDTPSLLLPSALTVVAQGSSSAETYRTVSFPIAAALTDGSETLSVTISSLLANMKLTDGVNTFTASNSITSVDVSTWNLSNLKLIVPARMSTTDTITVTAASTESDGSIKNLVQDVTLYADYTTNNRTDQAGTGNDDYITVNNNTSRDGGSGNDLMVGNDIANTLIGGSGNDVLLGNGGNDTLSGGTGNDRLEGGAGDDKLSGDDGNDMLLGGAGDDTLDGGAGNDVLDGGAGNDILIGGTGNDILLGGAGNDTLTGGTGADSFVWRAGDTGKDVIKDFTLSGTSRDTIDLHDLLQGENDGNILNYLRVDTATSTLLISSTGVLNASGSNADVTIKLENGGNPVDLSSYGSTSSQIVNSLIAGADPMIKVDHT